MNLCFNTEESFSKTLAYYQAGEYGDSYKTVEEIKDLKYNTGDWVYQCFDTVYCASEKELSTVFESDIDQQIKEIMEIYWEASEAFKETNVFHRIPKSDGFIAYCIDHDEEVLDVLEKLKM